MKWQPSIADTKLQVDQIKRNIVATFNKPLFILKSNNFEKSKNHKISSKENR